MSLRDRILSRLALAKAATPGPWTVDNADYAEAIYAGHEAVIAGGRWGGEASVFSDTADAVFIADRDPVAVVRECQADLALLDFIEDGAHPPSPWVDDFLANLSDRYPEGNT